LAFWAANAIAQLPAD
jgi:hypothetical protein